MTHRIPFQDLGRLHNSIRDELDEVILRAIEDSAFIGGDQVVSFENEFASAHRSTAAVGCGSGTDALALAPWQALGEAGCDELRSLVRPLSKAIVDGGTFGLR